MLWLLTLLLLWVVLLLLLLLLLPVQRARRVRRFRLILLPRRPARPPRFVFFVRERAETSTAASRCPALLSLLQVRRGFERSAVQLYDAHCLRRGEGSLVSSRGRKRKMRVSWRAW